MLWKYPNLFEQKKFTRNYFSEIDNIFTPKQAIEMEKYMIDTYCTYQGEEVLTSFYGKLYANKMAYDGRIHITSFRIFVFGRKEEEPSGVFIFNPKVLPFGFAILEALIRSSIRKHFKKQNAELLSKYGNSQEVPNFGYQYRLINAEKIARDNNIGITCHLETKKTDMYQREYIEKIKFDMGLYPRQLKDEKPEEMAERMKYIASLIKYNQTEFNLFEL